MTLWVRAAGDGRWTWGRGEQVAGHLTANDAGGIEPVDATEDLDLVTALLMARTGLDRYDPAAAAVLRTDEGPAALNVGAWERSTAGRAKGTGDGPTLGQRAARTRHT